MGRRKIETTKNIYGHLFAQDRSAILSAMNQAVTRLTRGMSRTVTGKPPNATSGRV
jgi:hypothetical protein